MRNTKVISIFLIIFVLVTIWVQFGDIKNFFVKAKTFIQGEGNVFQNDNLQAFPYYISENLITDIQNANLPGPLNRGEGTSTSKELTFNSTQVISETNIYRNQNGIKSLETSETLNKMAEDKLNDMFLRGYFDHISPLGTSIEDIARDFGYEYLIVGENLALGGFKNAKDVVTAWSESPPHKENMLDGRYTEIGIATRRDLYNGHYTTIIVQHFGKSVGSCPIVSKQTKDRIDSLQNSLELTKREIEKFKELIEEDEAEYLITEHNKLVAEYNKKLSELRALVEEYNKAVSNFNNCIEKTTS